MKNIAILYCVSFAVNIDTIWNACILYTDFAIIGILYDSFGMHMNIIFTACLFQTKKAISIVCNVRNRKFTPELFHYMNLLFTK